MPQSKWVRVRNDRPCEICQKPDYCTRTTDGKAAKCMRIKSEKEVPGKDGSIGWLHKIGDPIPVHPEKEPVQIKDVTAVAKKMYFDPMAADKREEIAKSLGVSVASLEALRVGIGWDRDGEEYASFPSRDAACKIIGITRRYHSGEKKTLAGTSNSGIFVPVDWWKPTGPVLIVEGASDVAALVTHGFACLGRPSNIGGAKVILAYLGRRALSRRIVVVGENDLKPERVGTVAQCAAGCFGCSWCWPGKYGAINTSGRLRCEWIMPPEGIKDVRQWTASDRNFRVSIEAMLLPKP